MPRRKIYKTPDQKIVYFTVALNPQKKADKIAIAKYTTWKEYLEKNYPENHWTTNAILRELLFNLSDEYFNGGISLTSSTDIEDFLDNLRNLIIVQFDIMRERIGDLEKKITKMIDGKGYFYMRSEGDRSRHDDGGYISHNVVEGFYADDDEA